MARQRSTLPSEMRLIYRGRALRIENTVNKSGLGQGSILHCVHFNNLGSKDFKSDIIRAVGCFGSAKRYSVRVNSEYSLFLAAGRKPASFWGDKHPFSITPQ